MVVHSAAFTGRQLDNAAPWRATRFPSLAATRAHLNTTTKSTRTDRGCVRSTSRSGTARPGVFGQLSDSGHPHLLRLVLRTQPRSGGGSKKMRPPRRVASESSCLQCAAVADSAPCFLLYRIPARDFGSITRLVIVMGCAGVNGSRPGVSTFPCVGHDRRLRQSSARENDDGRRFDA